VKIFEDQPVVLMARRPSEEGLLYASEQKNKSVLLSPGYLTKVKAWKALW